MTGSLERNGQTFDYRRYGPEVHFVIKDSLGREWRGGTIQLDFNLPELFELDYVDAGGQRRRPVMIHRAIMGSFDRVLRLLEGHFDGRLDNVESIQALADQTEDDVYREAARWR